MNVRRSARWLPLVFLLALLRPVGVEAQEKVFRLQGVDQTLVNVSPETDVYFRSMRLNRALNVWNVEVTVSNKTSRTLSGPVVLLIDSFQGTGGPVSPDGLDDSQPGKAFYELSVGSNPGPFVPAGTTTVRTLTLSRSGSATVSPSLIAQVYAAPTPVVPALGVTRSLDEVGRPLPGVSLSVSGPKGTVQQVSDLQSGVASFGQGAGDHRVTFSADGYLPVWRRQMLATDSTAVLPNPRLTRRSDHPFAVTPAGGIVVSNSSASIQMLVPPGAVTAEAEFHLTPVTGQTLPAFLPQGWSPLSAFWIESSQPLQKAFSAVLLPAGPIAAGESAALVRWNDQTLQWMVAATVSGNGVNAVTVPIESLGAYALVVADAAELAPPAPQAGQPLLASAVSPPDVAGLTATGTVTPAVSPASVVPERVTGIARVELKHATAKLPSGWLLRGEVTETYLLLDGSIRLTPQYEHFIVGYQRPGDADSQTLGAEFPMRPVLLFGPEQLKEATVRVDVLPEQPFDGQVLDAKGGQMIRDGVRLIAGTGTLTAPSALRLRRLDATAFTNLVGNGHVLTAAFDLTVDGSTLGSHLSAQLGGVPANTRFVLARILSETGYFGLQPVERLQSDAQGTLLSLEPASGDRLPGLRGSGQFLLVQVNEPQGLIRGVARTGAGTVRANLPVSLAGLPWLSLTDAQGRYELVSPAGSRELSVRDPATGDVGRVQITLTNPGTPLTQDLDTAPRGPRVAKITPAANATRVPRVGSVVIEFDEPVNPASVVNAIQLLKPDNSPVSAAMVLNLANRIATLSPATELDANTVYRVSLAATISDPSGLPLEGVREFSFTTVPLSTRDPAAQLIIYQPGATNVPSAILDEIPAYEPGNDASAIVVHGTPGVADPEVPVVLVNESTGETATVLSKPDGSFSSVISGSEQDFVSATFVNLNGTRVNVPVSRQEFDNGFVGLYPQGGILEAQSDGGPVQVLIQPEAIPNRTKFRVKSLNVAELLKRTGGVSPEAGTVAGGAMEIELQGDALRGPIKLKFPVDLAALGYPTNELGTTAAVAMAVVRDTQDMSTFEVVDQMRFTPDPPANPGLARTGRPVRSGAFQENRELVGALENLIGFTPQGFVADAVVRFVILPLLVGSREMAIKGEVYSIPLELNQAITAAQLPASFVPLGSELITAAQKKVAKPLSGAFIVLNPLINPFNAPPGRLRPGVVYATSGADGKFLLVAPSSSTLYGMVATHPSYQERIPEPIFGLAQLSIAGVVYKDFFFQYPVLSQTPPTVNISHSPQWPAPGQETEVTIIASQAVAAPKIGARVFAVNSLVGGVTATQADATLTNIVENTSGTTTRWTAKLSSAKSVQVQLRTTIQAQNGVGASVPVLPYFINFSGPPPAPTNSPLPAPDTNDVHGPFVVSTLPPENGFVDESGAVTLVFNKPIDAYVKDHPEGITLGGQSGALPPPRIELSRSQTTLRVQFMGLEPDTEYTLSLSGQSVRDLAAQSLDQRPSTSAEDSFTMRFRTAPAPNVPLLEMGNGRGSVINGQWLYAIDQSAQGNSLLAYSLRDPAAPALLGRTRLPGAPRDLVFIPKYSFKRHVHAPVETADLMVVVGGDLDTAIGDDASVIVRGQYLWVFNMANPLAPELLAQPIVTYRVSSVVSKARWSPPYVVYQEFGADIQMLGFVNLQELIIGYGSSELEREAFRPNGTPGVDVNGDGDFVDEGEQLPIPQRRPIEFYGKHQNYVLERTTQKILDFSVTGGGRSVGVTLKEGSKIDRDGKPTGARLLPSYRTLVFNGFPLDLASPTNASVFFGTGSYPRWVTLFDALRTETNGVPVALAAAVVSLEPDADGVQKLALIDLSVAKAPKLLNAFAIPDGLLGGGVQSLKELPDGTLELAGSRNRLILDPRYLAVPTVSPDRLHPAIVSLIPGAGGVARSLGSSDYGVYSVVDGARKSVVQVSPKMAFVSFPGEINVVSPAALAVKDDAQLKQILQGMRLAGAIPPARVHTNLNITSDLNPPRVASHFHVFVTAPGSAGRTIELGLESLNHAGRPLSNLGVGFAPVRAVSKATQEKLGQVPRSGCGAPIRSLTAWRMSSDPNSEFYNRYLSRPFALVANEQVSAEEIAQLQSGLDREILWSGAALRAFIDPSQSGAIGIGSFAARIDDERKRLHPVSVVTAFTLDAPYVMGDFPPPAGGAFTLPGTFQMVSGQSGELRVEAADLTIPSPRMPIVVQRTIGNQDIYEGPFGVGWDFNYGQRVTELDPQSFPIGLQMPVVARSKPEESEVAGSQDVLFQTGMGRTILFKWKSTNMPPEYSADPLVRELDYQRVASDYFFPENRQGVFDLLVKFKDGRFERLTPDGVRYRYAPQGQLEMVIDRFPKNRHELENDQNGWLVRIDDRSVTSDRFVEFGHYRRASDPDFTARLDEATTNPFLEGKICRLRDYAGRDVLFSYTADGFLERRDGVKVDGENGGFSGRAQTHYSYRECRLIGITSGAEGAPIFNADVVQGKGGKPVVQSGTGSSAVQFDIPLGNSAASASGQKSSATQPDGRKTEVTFDELGHPTSIQLTGAKGEDSIVRPRLNQAGQLEFIQQPEGRTETRVYDTNNPAFRSRGNLLSISVDPGPRGGEAYTETFAYDPRYNLPSGDFKDANGFTHTHVLQGDGRAPASTTHGSSGSEITRYNERGQVEESTDIRGVRTAMNYDATTGFLRRKYSGDYMTEFGYDGSLASRLGSASTVTPPAGAGTRFKYNALQQVVETVRDRSQVRRAYDERGNEILTQRELGDGSAKIVRQEFDAKGFLRKTTTEGVEVDGASADLTYEYLPDDLSRLKEIRHPGGTVQVFEYDKRNRPIKMTLGTYVEEYLRDRHGNVLEIHKGGDVVRANEYDGLDRPKRVIRKTGTQDETESSTYFAGGQVRTTILSDPIFGVVKELVVGAVDEVGRPTVVTLKGDEISPVNEYGYKPLESTVTGPRMPIRTTWNGAGHVLSIENPILSHMFHPDPAGRNEEVEQVEDGFTYKAFSTFNDLDQIRTHSDLLGLNATFDPRVDGLNLSILNARGNATTYEYSVLGELRRRRRADGLEFQFQRDSQRQTRFGGDPSAGFRYTYDGEFRLTQRTQRDGQPIQYRDFDSRQMPQTVSLPGGGSISMEYDLQQRLRRRIVRFQSTTYDSGSTHDAAGRVRNVTYQQDNGPGNSTTMTYDPSGVFLQARHLEAEAEFVVNYSHNADGTRRTITYPSGWIVTEDRDVSGRLLGISDAGGNILKATAWRGHQQPREISLGSWMVQVNQFDARGRKTASRVTRSSDNSVLSHLRTQFDAANNVDAHQYIHRGARADLFTYDTGERLFSAQMGVIPLVGGGTDRVLYGRNYSYNSSGLDLLLSAPMTGDPALVPPFAAAWSSHDGFLQPEVVNGFNRGRADPMGRVIQAELQVRSPGGRGSAPVAATLIHNGRGDLVRVDRADGVTVENQYQPGGLRFLRRVLQNGVPVETRHFVYDDQARLIEEYDRTGTTPALLARYFYAGNDAPAAADLWDFDAKEFHRYHYLRDGAESVIAVADANGAVVERVWYDPFGQPVIEQRDDAAPALQRIMAGPEGSLLLVMSETVSPPASDPGEGSAFIRINPLDLTAALTVSADSKPLAGTVELLASLEGFAPYSVLKFAPTEPLPVPVSSLLGWWPGDSRVSDVVGGNDGALRGGATVGPGILQQAYVLNGSSAFIEITNAVAGNVGGGDFTASLWASFSGLAGEQVLIEKWVTSTRSGWSLIKSDDRRLRLVLGDSAGGESVVESAPLDLAIGRWVQIAARRQGGQIQLFTNGVVVASGTVPSSLASTATVKFGSREGTSRFLNGSLDEVTLYSRALTDGELTAVAGGVSVVGPLSISLKSGVMADEWGNTNAEAAVSFAAIGEVGTVYFDAEPAMDTSARRLARSSVGSPFLFHGQYFDYDSGLIYLRARFYDPYSGMFLEPDPLGYEDSVNLYAGFKNNPARFRDPSGLGIFDRVRSGVQKLFGRVEKMEQGIGGSQRVASKVGHSLDTLQDAPVASLLGAGNPTRRPPRPGAKYSATEMQSQYRGEHIPDPKVKDWEGVGYLDEIEREASEIKVKDGLLYRGDELLDTTKGGSMHSGGSGAGIFVMDEYGKIYANPVQSKYFRHSSFLAGGDVATAGELVVEKGVIKSVTRRSGHYLPEKDTLDFFKAELHERGVDVSSIFFDYWKVSDF